VANAFAARRDRLRALLRERDVDATLVTRPVNVRYLTGVASSNAALLVLVRDRDVLATDGRYATQARAQAPDLELVVDRRCAEVLVARAAKHGLHRLGFEAHDVTVEAYGPLTDAAAPAGLATVGRLVERLRAVKDEEEITLLATACAISDRALTDTLPRVRPGMTERAVAYALEDRMRERGADGAAFETIVASGPNSAVPHHRPTDRELAAGDLLKIDFGARYRGYHADETRTFVVGREPAGWHRDLHALVAQAQRAGRDALAPGADVLDVDRAARSVVEAAGHGPEFPHGLGHGVGLEIHEAPTIGYSATGRLAARTPVTVEPGVYLPGRGGVRIEDTLVVRDGGPQLLTTSTRELLVL
jgi:Xaa-Pro aminopeptidase